MGTIIARGLNSFTPGHDFNERKRLTPTSKKTARRPTGKVHLSATASGLTSQAGLIPVIKFLERIGFEELVKQTVAHVRGDNAAYQLVEDMLLTLVGVIGGARSIAKVCAVWSDGVFASWPVG